MGKPELFGDGLEGLSHAPLLEETHQGPWLTSSSPISTTSDPELGRCPVNPQGVGCQDEKKLRGHLIRPLQCRDPPPPHFHPHLVCPLSCWMFPDMGSSLLQKASQSM